MKKLNVCLLLLAMLSVLASTAQNKVITGRVTDARDGAGMIGVTIQPKGIKGNTAFTKEDGTYSITVPVSANSLVFTSVGFVTQEVSIAGKTTADVILSVAVVQQAEAVVIGYGSQKRKDVTGSIAKVDGAKISSVPAPSFDGALSGKAAGVNVTTSNGLAGAASIIRIRGVSSISVNGDPLYVIDGIPLDVTNNKGNTRGQLAQDRNPLTNINPNDIESIEVLKDAAAAGIYGSRGANGVVLVTTKRGKGRGKFTFNNSIGIVQPSLKPKFADKNTWLGIRQEAWELDGNTGPQQNLPGRSGGFSLTEALNNPGTDWWNLGTQTGVNHDHTLAYQKGTNKWSAYIGGTYSYNESYAVGSDNTRIGIRGNFDYRPNNKVTVSVNSAYYTSRTDMINNNWNGGLSFAMGTALPYYPVYNTDGSYFKASGNGLTWTFGENNPVYQQNNTKFRNTENRVILGGTASYKPVKDLTLTASVSKEMNNGIFTSYRNAVFANRADGVSGNGNYYLDKYDNYVFTGTAQYNWQINTENKVTILAGGEYQDQSTKGKDIYYDTLQKPFYDGKPSNFENTLDSRTFATNYARVFRSFFARLNYNFAEKILLQASVRRDESSIFRKNNRTAYFPTVSGAWVITNEDFMNNVNFINYLKLRAGWGLVGSDKIPFRAGYPTVDTTRNSGSVYGGNSSIFYVQGNPDLKWETSNNYDVALEFGFLKNRISGEIGYYKKISKDLLLNPPFSGYNGQDGAFWQNLGKVMNEGVEFSLNTVNVKKNHFSWNTNFNIAYNYNEVLNIGGMKPDALGGGTNETRIIPGYPVGTIYTVRYYGVDPADGLPIFLDKNGNKTKTLNVAAVNGDKVPVANVYPYVTGGFTNTFKYRDFELNALFTYQFGGHIWDNSGKRNMGYITDWNIYSFYVGNYWRQPGDIAKYPRPTLAGYPGVEGNAWSNNSSLQVYDSDFVRLKELSLGYTLPSKWTKKLRLQTAKVYLSGYNLLLFTKYPIGDPEIARDADSEFDEARNQSYNANFLTLPQGRVFNFGINISF